MLDWLYQRCSIICFWVRFRKLTLLSSFLISLRIGIFPTSRFFAISFISLIFWTFDIRSFIWIWSVRFDILANVSLQWALIIAQTLSHFWCHNVSRHHLIALLLRIQSTSIAKISLGFFRLHRPFIWRETSALLLQILLNVAIDLMFGQSICIVCILAVNFSIKTACGGFSDTCVILVAAHHFFFRRWAAFIRLLGIVVVVLLLWLNSGCSAISKQDFRNYWATWTLGWSFLSALGSWVSLGAEIWGSWSYAVLLRI